MAGLVVGAVVEVVLVAAAAAAAAVVNSWPEKLPILSLGVLNCIILSAARRPPRPGHDARSGAFPFAGYRGAASAG